MHQQIDVAVLESNQAYRKEKEKISKTNLLSERKSEIRPSSCSEQSIVLHFIINLF